jgi:hypothetical protein
MGLKESIIEYVGNKLKPENNEVTMEMIVQVMAEEFPDFVLALVQENFLRGYEHALDEVLEIEKEKQRLQEENNNAT